MKETKHELTVSPKQQQAILLLVSGKSVKEVAEEVGVHRSTIWAWRQQEPFQAYFNALVKELQLQTTERLLGLWDFAVETLHVCMAGSNDHARFKAAKYVLDFVMSR